MYWEAAVRWCNKHISLVCYKLHDTEDPQMPYSASLHQTEATALKRKWAAPTPSWKEKYFFCWFNSQRFLMLTHLWHADTTIRNVYHQVSRKLHLLNQENCIATAILRTLNWYCCAVWGSGSKASMHNLLKLQKKATHVILDVWDLKTKSDSMFPNLSGRHYLMVLITTSHLKLLNVCLVTVLLTWRCY